MSFLIFSFFILVIIQIITMNLEAACDTFLINKNLPSSF